MIRRNPWKYWFKHIESGNGYLWIILPGYVWVGRSYVLWKFYKIIQTFQKKYNFWKKKKFI